MHTENGQAPQALEGEICCSDLAQLVTCRARIRTLFGESLRLSKVREQNLKSSALLTGEALRKAVNRKVASLRKAYAERHRHEAQQTLAHNKVSKLTRCLA